MAFTTPIEGDDEGFHFTPIDEDRLQHLVICLVDTQEELVAGVLQRVDANRRHHRARGSRGKTLPHFTLGDYDLVARVSRQGKHRKLMNTWTGPWRVTNDDKEHVYAVQHLVTAELPDVHVARMRFTPMTSSRSSASSSRFSNISRTRASTTPAASRLSSRLQATTRSLLRWRGKDWGRLRAPGSRCPACSITRRPCCANSSRRCS